MALPAPGYLSNAERTNAEMKQALEDQRDFISGIVGSVSTLTASAALTAGQLGLVLIDATAGDVTVTLPASIAELGIRDVIVRRTDNTGNRLVVQATGSDRIKFHTHLRPEGYPFLVLMGAGDFWQLRSDGAGGWWPVARLDSDALGRPVFETTTVFAPGGWGALAGAVLQRADWPWLWDHALQSGMLTTEAGRVGMEGGWTSGDGATTFRVPEGRAEFIRVLDEGRGVDSGRVAGSSQASQNLAHDHDMYFRAASEGAGGITDPEGFVTPVSDADLGMYTNTTAIQAAGGTESRPRSIAYPGRIKLI